MPLRTRQHGTPTHPLQGWAAIAAYLGQPVSTAQRWASDGLPVERRGRNVIAERAALDRWVTEQSGAPAAVHLVHRGERDLLEDLRSGLRAVKKRR